MEKLISGKNYKNVLGELVTILKFDAMNQRFIDTQDNDYSVDGRYMRSSNGEFDLVELFDEPNMSHSGIQKEHCKGTCQIYTNNYGRMPLKIEQFAKIAKDNFPDLKDDNIQVVFFDGTSKKGIMGIRFNISGDTQCPNDYFNFSENYMLDDIK